MYHSSVKALCTNGCERLVFTLLIARRCWHGILNLRYWMLGALKICEAPIEPITAAVMVRCWTRAHLAHHVVAVITSIVNLSILNLDIWPIPRSKPASLVLAFRPVPAA